MRKSVLLVVVIVLALCGCGKQQTENPPPEIIQASSLISLEAAMDILGTTLVVFQPDKEIPPGAIQCVYDSEDVMLTFSITQDALLSGLNLEYGGAKNGFQELVKYQKEDAPEDILPAKGIGDEAYFIDLAHTDQWSLHFLRKDHFVSIHLFGPGDKEWTIGKLSKLGKVADENLK